MPDAVRLPASDGGCGSTLVKPLGQPAIALAPSGTLGMLGTLLSQPAAGGVPPPGPLAQSGALGPAGGLLSQPPAVGVPAGKAQPNAE
jgi:hypothetical protein